MARAGGPRQSGLVWFHGHGGGQLAVPVLPGIWAVKGAPDGAVRNPILGQPRVHLDTVLSSEHGAGSCGNKPSMKNEAPHPGPLPNVGLATILLRRLRKTRRGRTGFSVLMNHAICVESSQIRDSIKMRLQPTCHMKLLFMRPLFREPKRSKVRINGVIIKLNQINHGTLDSSFRQFSRRNFCV
jgi:hypothetical protein